MVIELVEQDYEERDLREKGEGRTYRRRKYSSIRSR